MSAVYELLPTPKSDLVKAIRWIESFQARLYRSQDEDDIVEGVTYEELACGLIQVRETLKSMLRESTTDAASV